MFNFLKRLFCKSKPVNVKPVYADSLEANASYEYWY